MPATATRQEEGVTALVQPPRDEAYRVLGTGVEYRAAAGDGGDSGIGGGGDAAETGPGVMTGHFAVFGRMTEIDSWFEGNFMEVVDRGAFKKTFSEGRSQMRCLFQHGHDPQIGDKPIGTIQELREDDVGAFYEVQLLDASYVADIEAGLRENVYGASFRFRVIREEMDMDPGVSADNPKGLPIRTLKEVEVREFGPVTWGAYPDATAGMRSGLARSVTDDIYFDRLAADPAKLGALIERLEALREEPPAPVAEGDSEATDPAGEPEVTEGDTSPSEDEQDPQAEPADVTPEGADDTDQDEGRSTAGTDAGSDPTSVRGSDLYTGGKGTPSWLLS